MRPGDVDHDVRLDRTTRRVQFESAGRVAPDGGHLAVQFEAHALAFSRASQVLCGQSRRDDVARVGLEDCPFDSLLRGLEEIGMIDGRRRVQRGDVEERKPMSDLVGRHDRDLDAEFLHRGHDPADPVIDAGRNEQHARPVEHRVVVVDGTDETAPVRPDHRRLVSHRRHAGLRIEPAHDATRGRRRSVPDISVAIDDDHLVATATQFAAHRAADDAGTDDAGSHGSRCFSKNASVSAQASSAAPAS